MRLLLWERCVHFPQRVGLFFSNSLWKRRKERKAHRKITEVGEDQVNAKELGEEEKENQVWTSPEAPSVWRSVLPRNRLVQTRSTLKGCAPCCSLLKSLQKAVNSSHSFPARGFKPVFKVEFRQGFPFDTETLSYTNIKLVHIQVCMRHYSIWNLTSFIYLINSNTNCF